MSYVSSLEFDAYKADKEGEISFLRARLQWMEAAHKDQMAAVMDECAVKIGIEQRKADNYKREADQERSHYKRATADLAYCQRELMEMRRQNERSPQG